jgi:predicted nucleic acid-binding Zn ribbon protein
MTIKKSNEYTLKEAIEELLNTYAIKKKVDQTKILQSWAKVCGDIIDKHTEKIYIKNKILFVKVDSASLKNELFYAKSKLIKHLNNEVGDNILEDIVFL